MSYILTSGGVGWLLVINFIYFWMTTLWDISSMHGIILLFLACLLYKTSKKRPLKQKNNFHSCIVCLVLSAAFEVTIHAVLIFICGWDNPKIKYRGGGKKTVHEQFPSKPWQNNQGVLQSELDVNGHGRQNNKAHCCPCGDNNSDTSACADGWLDTSGA